MKKIFCVVCIIAICTIFFGCDKKVGNNNSTISESTPKDIEAAVVYDAKISANSIFESCDEMSFYNRYAANPVTVTGTIESISNSYITLMSRPVEVYSVLLEEGWQLELYVQDHPEIDNFSVGDKVKIESRMQILKDEEYISIYDIGIRGTGANSTYSDDSTITLLK